MSDRFKCPEPSMAALKAYWDAPDDEDHIPSIQAAFDADVPQIVRAEVERALASFSEPGVQSVVTDLAAKYVRERFGEEPGTPKARLDKLERFCTELAKVVDDDPSAWPIESVRAAREYLR